MGYDRITNKSRHPCPTKDICALASTHQHWITFLEAPKRSRSQDDDAEPAITPAGRGLPSAISVPRVVQDDFPDLLREGGEA